MQEKRRAARDSEIPVDCESRASPAIDKTRPSPRGSPFSNDARHVSEGGPTSWVRARTTATWPPPPRAVARTSRSRFPSWNPTGVNDFSLETFAHTRASPHLPSPPNRYLSRLDPQAPRHRWQAEALAQEEEVSAHPEPAARANPRARGRFRRDKFFRVTRGPRAGFARRDRPEARASRPRSAPRAHPPVLEVLRTLTDPSPRLSSRYELGRQPANTKLSSHPDIRVVRCRGGNRKFRALRLDTGNFSWGSENTTHKTRILDVTYNASNNELVRRRTPSRAFPVPGVRRARSGCDGRRANATERSTRERRLPRLVSPLPRSLTARARR